MQSPWMTDRMTLLPLWITPRTTSSHVHPSLTNSPPNFDYRSGKKSWVDHVSISFSALEDDWDVSSVPAAAGRRVRFVVADCRSRCEMADDRWRWLGRSWRGMVPGIIIVLLLLLLLLLLLPLPLLLLPLPLLLLLQGLGQGRCWLFR